MMDRNQLNDVYSTFFKPQKEEPGTVDSVICSKCGGICCKSMGCHIRPSDFKNLTVDTIKELIRTGTVSIDWWEGNPLKTDEFIERVYFLRIRNKNADILDPAWHAECMLLTDNGCMLDYKNRPYGATSIIPAKCDDENYEPSYSKQQCAIEWIQYQDILTTVMREMGITRNSIAESMQKLTIQYMLEQMLQRKEN